MHWGKVVLHGLMLVILFLAAAIIVNPLTDGIYNDTLRITVKEIIRIGFTILLLWVYARQFLKKPNSHYRIPKRFHVKKLWVIIGLALPISVIVFYLLIPLTTVESQESISIQTILSLLLTSFVTACSAGIIEEMVFRGYLFKLVETKWNVTTAVLVTSILFGALHLLTVSEIQASDVLMILIVGTLVGIMFALIVVKTGSVWNAVVVHVLWNFFMNPRMIQIDEVMDRMMSSLVLLRLKSDSIWMTGGAYGIDVAIPAIVLYIVIIIWLLTRKTKLETYNTNA